MNFVTLSAMVAAIAVPNGLAAGCGGDDQPPAVDAGPNTPDLAPLPETARGPAIPEKGYLVEEIDAGLYWVTEGRYQAMFLTTGAGVIVVDAPPSVNVAAAVAEVTTEPIRVLVYSHSHIDHIAGAATLTADNPEIVAHSDTARQLIAAGDPRRPAPTLTFDDEYTLTLGSQTLELRSLGAHHEPGNLYIYAPTQRVLMVIDIIFPGWTPFRKLALAEDVAAYIDAHDAILAYDFDVLVSGHVTRLGTRQDVEIQREYILDMRDNVLAAYGMVDFGEIIGELGLENPWHTFETYITRVVDICTERTESEWVGRLGAVDVFTRSHCDALADAVRVD